ncbi:MAG: pilus assembly protein PilM [Candidatus Delongbacteria bacterium]|jgi:Tfp pilus assembly PilM family ATPase|nr:pilus assembly protein PilM [Candidatus Delongbacteria bacterium]
MTNDPQNDSKSLGRNIFAENKAPLSTKKEENKKTEEQQPSKEKSMGRNMFSEPAKDLAESGNDEFNIIEDTSPNKINTSAKKVSKSLGKSKEINAIHITDKNIIFAQTFYDGSIYKLINLQVVPIELPKLTEENVFKDKEDPEIAIKRIQLEAIEKVFNRAGVSKNNPLIVSALSGKNIIVKEVFLKNTPEENIELELPSALPSPFDAFSKYEYEVLSSTGTEHRLLASIVDSKLFFGLQSILITAGVECKILDVDKMALINLYQESVNPPIGTVACIIDIGENSSNIIIVPNGNEELYIRSIDFTNDQFQKMLQKNRDISSEETVKMLKTRNFYDYITKAFESETTENLNQHYPVKKYIRMQLLRELQKTFQYYSGQNHNKIPSKIYITGKAVGMYKFSQFITKNTDISCETLDVAGFFEGDEVVKNYAKETQEASYICLGLALRYE